MSVPRSIAFVLRPFDMKQNFKKNKAKINHMLLPISTHTGIGKYGKTYRSKIKHKLDQYHNNAILSLLMTSLYTPKYNFVRYSWHTTSYTKVRYVYFLLATQSIIFTSCILRPLHSLFAPYHGASRPLFVTACQRSLLPS